LTIPLQKDMTSCFHLLVEG